MEQETLNNFEYPEEKNIEIEVPSIENEEQKPIAVIDYEKEELKQKAQKIQKERYRIAEENNQLRHLLDEAIRHTSQTSEAALLQMEQNTHLVLNQALEAKRRALEEGDTELALQADLEIGRSTAKLESIDNYQKQKHFEYQQQAAQQQILQQQMSQQKMAQQQALQHQEVSIPSPAKEWINENPWFLPSSPLYDPEKAQEVQAFTQILDKKIEREGRQEEYFSKEYFDQVNKYIDENFGRINKPLTYKTTNAPVSGVHRSSLSSPQKTRITLTEDERTMAKQMGIPEETWAKHKKINMQRQKERAITHGSY